MATIKKPSRSTPSFISGEQVELCGLENSPQMNRRAGRVAGGVLDNGRYPVALYEVDEQKAVTTHIQIAVKPENLKVFSGQVSECDGCKKIYSQLTVCGKCHMASYCSEPCQLDHWPTHKQACKSLKQARKANFDETELEKLPTDPEERIYVRSARADRWTIKGKHAKAEAEYRAMLQEPLLGRTLVVYILLADSIVAQSERPQKEEDAIAVLREAVNNLSPEEKHLEQVYDRLGQLLYNKQDFDGAEQAYKAALELGGNVPLLQKEIQKTKKARKDWAKKEKKKSSKAKKARGSASK